MLKKIYIEIASFLFYLSIVIINKTLRLKVVNAESFYNLRSKGQNVIYIFWHQASFVPLYHYRRERACILTMKSLRGEILARAGERLGYKVFRIERENDYIGLLQMLRLAREGYDCNIAVDGPTGPLFKMKPGALYLANKLNRPVMPLAVAAKPCWVVSWRWDKYFVPLPFARAVILFGDPIYPTENNIEETRIKCERALKDLTGQARQHLRVVI